MAKKKKVTKFDEQIFNDICTEYGDIIKRGSEILDDMEDYKVLSVSPAIDIALGGGLKEGTCVIITGDPKTGKSTTALHFAAKAQKAGKHVVYYDVEARLEKKNFKVKDIDTHALKVFGPTPSNPLITAEQYLNAAEKIIADMKDLVLIVDSTSCMVPAAELLEELKTSVRSGMPRLFSMFLKRISGNIRANKAIVIFITHNITNTSGMGYGPKKNSDGGVMLQYQASTNMIITHNTKWESNGSNVGQGVQWTIKASAAGGFPKSKAESWLRYGEGLDEGREIAFLAVDLTLIKKSGTWYTIQYAIDNLDHKAIKNTLTNNNIDPKDKDKVSAFFRAQGMDNLSDIINNNPELSEFLYDKIKEITNT
jgi:recombination protein RecA